MTHSRTDKWRPASFAARLNHYLIIFLMGLISPLWAAEPCEQWQVPSLGQPSLFDVYPLLFFSKGWNASPELKQHFAAQKRALPQLTASAPSMQTDAANTATVTASLAAVGDLMRLPSTQPLLDQSVKTLLSQFDLLTGNLETLISPDQPLPPTSVFLMNSSPALLDAFAKPTGESLLSAVSLANNHLFDFDDRAITQTIAALEQRGIRYSGAHPNSAAANALILEREGIKVGYVAVTSLMNQLDTMAASQLQLTPMLPEYDSTPFRARTLDACSIDLGQIIQLERDLRAAGADMTALSLHWGFEHEMYPRPQQLVLARRLMQAGFDIIFGAHTHTPQPAEVCFFNGYPLPESLRDDPSVCQLTTTDGKPRKAITFYSLGNFNSYTNVFWQQVGTIAAVDLVQRRDTTGGRATDWDNPRYHFTYTHTDSPPNGTQHMSLLTEAAVECPFAQCVNEVERMAAWPLQHMSGEPPSVWRLAQWQLLSLWDTVASGFHWLVLQKLGD